MNAYVEKPTTQEERDFIADNVIRFYKENPDEAQTNSYEQIRESVYDLLRDENIDRIKTEINIHNDASQKFFANLGFEKQSLIYLKD
jgi:hypothetical protein